MWDLWINKSDILWSYAECKGKYQALVETVKNRQEAEKKTDDAR